MKIYAYTIPMNESFYFDYAISGLRKNDHTVILKNQKQSRIAEIELCKHYDFDFIFFYGFSFMNHIRHQYNGESFFLPDALKKPFVVHWCDDPRRYMFDLDFVKEMPYTFFVCDSVLVEELRKDGFERTYYLPTMFDPDIQFPSGIHKDYECDVAFAGTIFDNKTLIKNRNGLGPNDNKILDEIRTKRTKGRYLDYIEELLFRHPLQNYNQLLQCALIEQKHDLRMDVFNTLKDFKLSVYGQGDGQLEDFPNFYKGRNLDQHHELPYLYGSSKVSLTIELLPSSVHQRIMECCGCGGFILAEDKADMAQCFDEFVVWSSLDELKDKVSFYLKNESERKKMANSMHQHVLARHTAEIRMKEMIEQWKKT